jgi:hypothetical protein
VEANLAKRSCRCRNRAPPEQSRIGQLLVSRQSTQWLGLRLATKRSNSTASTPLATAFVTWAERDFPCTKIKRVGRFSNVRCKARREPAIAGLSNPTVRQVIFTRNVDSAPFNPEFGLRKTGKLDPSLDPALSPISKTSVLMTIVSVNVGAI